MFLHVDHVEAPTIGLILCVQNVHVDRRGPVTTLIRLWVGRPKRPRRTLNIYFLI
jgi:hypothetical protein